MARQRSNSRLQAGDTVDSYPGREGGERLTLVLSRVGLGTACWGLMCYHCYLSCESRSMVCVWGMLEWWNCGGIDDCGDMDVCDLDGMDRVDLRGVLGGGGVRLSRRVRGGE